MKHAEVRLRKRMEALTQDDALLLATGRLVQVTLLFGSSVVIARELGPAGRAAYALPLALVGLVWAVCHLSFDRGILRLIGRRECSIQEAVSASLAFGMVVAFVGSAVAVGLGAAWPAVVGHASLLTMALAALSLPGMHLMYAAGELLLVVGRRRAWTACVTIGCALQLILVIVVAAEHSLRLHSALVLAALGTAVNAALLVTWLLRSVRLSRDRERIRRVARSSARVGIKLHPGSLALTTNSRLTLLVVGGIVSLRDTGFFSLAYNLADAVYSGVVALGSARLQRQTSLEEDEAVRYTRSSVRALLLAGAALCVPAAVCTYPLILVAFGHQWLPAVKLAVLLVLARTIIAPEELLRTLLERIAPPWYATGASVLALAVTLALAATLTALVGVVGAAVASVVGFATYGLALWRLIRRARRRRSGGVEYAASGTSSPAGPAATPLTLGAPEEP